MRRDQKALGCCKFLFKRLQGRGILLHYRCNREALEVSVIASRTSNNVDLQIIANCSIIHFPIIPFQTVGGACFFFLNSGIPPSQVPVALL